MRRAVWAVEVLFLLGLVVPSRVEADIWLDDARAASECKTVDGERPYVCDIGPPRPLSLRSFIPILQNDPTLSAMVARIGMPDRVDLQKVRVESPWLSWELRAYYRQYDRVYAFGRAFVLGNPEISLMRYEGPIPPAMWKQAPTGVPPPAEISALRAEQAAAHAEQLADASEQLAKRAEAATDHLSRDFAQRLRKH